MSLWSSIRVGRTAGKAAKVYRDVMGKPPSAGDAEYLMNMASLGVDEHNLAFDLLMRELKAVSYFDVDGSIVIEYPKKNDPLIQKIIQTLNWIMQTQKIRATMIEELERDLAKIMESK
jgi:hypothetical protein